MPTEKADALTPITSNKIPIRHKSEIENSGANRTEYSFEKRMLLKKRNPGTKSIKIMNAYVQKNEIHIGNALNRSSESVKPHFVANEAQSVNYNTPGGMK